MTETPRSRTGVLIIQLGTPDSPRTPDVRRYLREFLSDPRVLNMPALARWLLLEGVILRTRPRKSAAAYAKIWSSEGSPLLVHSEALREGVADALGDEYVVALGMRYGQPSIESALEALDEAGVDRVVALPLFPQYAAAVTASASARVQEVHSNYWDVRPLQTLGAFYDDPAFIEAWRQVAAATLEGGDYDHVLFSYHGLPERQVTRADRKETEADE